MTSASSTSIAFEWVSNFAYLLKILPADSVAISIDLRKSRPYASMLYTEAMPTSISGRTHFVVPLPQKCVKVVAHDPVPRTVANIIIVFQFVLAIIASVIDEFDEASENFWIKVLQDDYIFFAFLEIT
jgi:hypothetical protein